MIRDKTGQVLHYRGAMDRLLKALMDEKKWAVDYESEGQILGLKRSLHAISLEPGGQFEVSAAPRATLHEVRDLQMQIDREIMGLAIAKDWKFYELGVNPFESEDEIELLPSPRYRLMDAYFQKSGKRGRQMMRLSTGVQVNLDFSSESEAVSMIQTSFRVVPILATLFSNSPYLHGRATGNLSERHLIWTDTDAKRSGFLEAVFDSDFNFESYVRAVSKIPLMYYFDEGGKAQDPRGMSFNELPDSLKKANALSCMRQLFSEVRFKPCCVEIRSFDQLPDAYRYAVVAMSIGLVYDDENREIIADKMKDFGPKDLAKMMEDGARRGLKADRVYPLALDFLAMARRGLERRGFDEVGFLEPAEELMRSTVTPAEKLLMTVGERPL